MRRADLERIVVGHVGLKNCHVSETTKLLIHLGLSCLLIPGKANNGVIFIAGELLEELILAQGMLDE